jgi:lipopolysaccharide biosynthesis protein
LKKEQVVAFYLPQFYRTDENNLWWGDGFTEWTNVARARPVYSGHQQPLLPGKLGFYDTTHPSTIPEQVALAQKYGVDAFCFYHYWFSGKRVLDRPLEIFQSIETNFPFMICWANENWTRNWDGGNREILIQQGYLPDWPAEFVDSIRDVIASPNYLRHDGKPMLAIYRPESIPDVKKAMSDIRKHALEIGLGELYLLSVASFQDQNPNDFGIDAVIEFPPLGFGDATVTSRPKSTEPSFIGSFYDYYKLAIHSASSKETKFKKYFGIMPSWDNTPRRQFDSNIFLNASPYIFKVWLAVLRFRARQRSPHGSGEYIFVNAWNEWAEGATLEPSQNWGTQYLEAVSESVELAASFKTIDSSRQALLEAIRGMDEYSKYLGLKSDSANANWLKILKIIRQANPKTFVKVLQLLRHRNTRNNFIPILLRGLKGVWNSKEPWKPKTFIDETALSDNLDQELKVAVTIHLHYEEYLQTVIATIMSFPTQADFFISTSNEAIADQARKIEPGPGKKITVCLTRNRGRNFGPLFVEFLEEIVNYDVIIHLHSKMSKHSSKKFAEKWAKSNWELLGTNPELVKRALVVLLKTEGTAVVYADPSEIIPSSSFAWHSNFDIASGLFSSEILEVENKRFPFPAGGMFMMNPKCYSLLLSKTWNWEDFPDELGQLDGTLQHTIERLIGYIPFVQNLKQITYLSDEDRFTSDQSHIWS